MPPHPPPIRITNATLHNLKHISLAIPRLQLVAITGVSGSGKSTLAFDLIFEQGRRRYLQSIGMYSDLSEETGCESLTGLGPTVAVQQGIIRQSNPRSSVGTRSGLFTPLRLLFVAEGCAPCSACGQGRLISQACPGCGQAAEGLHSGYFSYNSPLGMCLHCQGHGYTFELNFEKLLPEPTTTIRQLVTLAGSQTTFNYLLRGLLKEYADRPYREAPEKIQRHILYGFPVGDGRMSHNLFDHLRWKYLKGREVHGCIRRAPCPECGGDRLGSPARLVRLHGKTLGELSQLSLLDLQAFFSVQAGASPSGALGHNLRQELLTRLATLCSNGLGHLTLYRDLPSLSGGELQRLFLSSHLDARLDSLIYILDEPSIGLHELEKQRLLEQLLALRDQGNSVLLVEHDPHLVSAADHVIDIGPLAGRGGGEVTYQGSYPGLLSAPGSITGAYLSGAASLPARTRLDCPPGLPALRMCEVWTNNLRGISLELPLGRMLGVAGVSGSGKSSLVLKTLAPLLDRHFARQAKPQPEEAEEEPPEDAPVLFSGRLEGVELLRGFSTVSQQPIGRHDNSNPASYLKIWDVIRKLFASLPEAAAAGLTPADFSFNSRGACPTCSGAGKQRLWLGGSVFTTHTCPQCQGRRFAGHVLALRWRGKNIADVLEMPVDEACEFFADTPAITRVLRIVAGSGMGYLPLGQPATTLSGGEAQRIKLANEISRTTRGSWLYILDEPTIGLSLYDTGRLLELLDGLVQKGSTVLVVEHDPQVLSRCDWLFELGPGGAGAGGQLIASGTPAVLAANPHSLIGPFLHA